MPMQESMRACLKFLSQAWASLSAPSKATWDLLAAASNYSTFNAYVSKNAFRHRNNLPVGQESDYIGAGPAASAPTTTPAGGVRMITLSIADGATVPDWGWMIHRGLTGFTPSWANVVAMVPRSGTPTVYVDTPLAPGAYFYRIKGFMVDGLFGATEVERTASAT
jgi:hypothetical protein